MKKSRNPYKFLEQFISAEYILYGLLKKIVRCFFNSLYYCLALEIHKPELQTCKKTEEETSLLYLAEIEEREREKNPHLPHLKEPKELHRINERHINSFPLKHVGVAFTLIAIHL